LKVAAYFVSNHYSNLEFIPPSQRERRPDIKILNYETEIFIEVKLLSDTSKWGHIQDSLRSIPSGLLVVIRVNFGLYNQQVEQIITRSRDALLCRNANTLPSPINLGYATIDFRNSAGLPANSTQVMISPLDALSVVGDEVVERNSGELSYSDIRRIFESKLEEAIPQLSSVEGCQIVVFDVDAARLMSMGGPDVLADAFGGTPMLVGRREDGIFANREYSLVDAVVTFVGDAPSEVLANPTGQSRCLSLLGLNGLEAAE
jgi:hypothetical protein